MKQPWGGKDYLIAPSILSANFAKLGEEVRSPIVTIYSLTSGQRAKKASEDEIYMFKLDLRDVVIVAWRCCSGQSAAWQSRAKIVWRL
jgi:hypothetical protein